MSSQNLIQVGRWNRWKPAKAVWANQLTRLSCLVVYAKVQLVFTTSEIGSQLLLASTSSNVLLGRGSVKAFNQCLGVGNFLPSAALVQLWLLNFMRWQVYHCTVLVGKVVRFLHR